MGWLDKVFGRPEDDEEEEEIKKPPPEQAQERSTSITDPFAGLNGINFGRYNDNNKSYAKTQRWYEAEDLFKEKKYNEAFDAFFDYIRNDEVSNVRYERNGDQFTFEIIQGSKKIYGTCDGQQIVAHAPLAIMDVPSTAVMRRLLELNYAMYYTRCAMNEQQALCMMFDTALKSASPSKMYYGLRELATKADRQDDLLMADFPVLKPANTDHVQPVSEQELAVKYKYFIQWIKEALDKTTDLNADSFSGAIAYEFLSLLYRIDFLITPEARLLAELERISSLYWDKKDEIPLVERNQRIREALRKLVNTTREDFAAGVYRTTGTFAITTPAPLEKVKDNIAGANKDAQWYVENKYAHLAVDLNEYGVVYSNYAYSMPRVLKDLSTIYMAVIHAAFFKELGMREPFYNEETRTFNRPAIEQAVNNAINYFPDKYKNLRWDHGKVNYESLYAFGTSFSDQMAHLNLDVKK